MSTIKHTRGSMSLPIDGVRLEQAIRLRGYTSKAAAAMCGCTAANLSQIKRRGSITAEMRSKLRNVLGIREDEYLVNAILPCERLKADAPGTQNLSIAGLAQHVQKSRERSQTENGQQEQAACIQAEDVILIRRDELKSIVKDAVLDVLRSMVGGADA